MGRETQGEAEVYPVFWGLAVDLSEQKSKRIAGLQFSIECVVQNGRETWFGGRDWSTLSPKLGDIAFSSESEEGLCWRVPPF